MGVEDQIHKQFAKTIFQYEAYKKLNCVFWSYMPFGEKRSAVTASLLKCKGTKTGVPDYLFIKRVLNFKHFPEQGSVDHFVWIEFKKPKTNTAKGKQSESQKDFELRFSDSFNTRYYVAYSVEEAVKILEKESILINV